MSVYTCHLFLSKLKNSEYDIANVVRNSLGYIVPINTFLGLIIVN